MGNKSTLCDIVLFQIVIIFCFSGMIWAQDPSPDFGLPSGKGEQFSRTLMFNNPDVFYVDRKYPVNYCFDPYSQKGCGKVAADNFCRFKGLKFSQNFGQSKCTQNSFHFGNVSGSHVYPSIHGWCFTYIECSR